VLDGETVDLCQFGPYSSLEFPGGAVDPEDHTLKSGLLKELVEETEVPDQTAMVYRRKPPFFAQGADLALEAQVCVVHLTNLGFEKYVKTDGGLHVMALSPEDVQNNIWAGNIRSGQAALLGWAFYQEVEKALEDTEDGTRRYLDMCNADYLQVIEVNITK
jgi:ADP-ribose pyrophosphatase YjhB (NUDIX family)